MKYIKTFVGGIMGGLCIALGGVAFLSIDNKVIGALFFTLGLFTIVTMNFNLFTGKVAYLFDNKPSYLIDLALIWLGNFVGAFITALLVNATRIYTISEKALKMCETKLADNLPSIFILAMFCNLLIFIAVDGYKNNPHQVGKYLALLFGVAGFILCGYEHCVANMFYISVAHMWSGKAFLYLAVMTLGNAVGALIIPLFRMIPDSKKKA